MSDNRPKPIFDSRCRSKDRRIVIRHLAFIRHSAIHHSAFRGLATGGLLIALVVILAVAGIVALLILGKPGRDDDPIYNYSSVQLPTMDPSLVHWRQLATIKVFSGNPRGIALDAAGNLIVAGESLERIYKPTGESRGTLADPVPLPQPGQCVAVDASGRVFVGLKDRVAVVEPGKSVAQWAPIEGSPDVSSIACTPDGNDVFVADRGDSVVLHYDGGGKLLGVIGRDDSTGKPDRYHTQRLRCFDVAIGPEGLLRVVNPDKHAIDTYKLDGTLESHTQLPLTGIEGSHGCCNPTDIAMLPDGSVVASEKGSKLPRVKIYDANGKMTSVVAPTGVFADESLLDLAADSRGLVYVLDPDKNTVVVFERIKQSATGPATVKVESK